jgi:hypothetical protein
VFALNNFFIALLLFLVHGFWRSPSSNRALLTMFCFALGLGNHQTLLFYGVPICLWMVWVRRAHLLNVTGVTKIVAVSLLGLSTYLYLPIAGRQPSLTVWGEPSTWNGFWSHLLRKQYGTFQLAGASQSGQLFTNSWVYLRSIPAETLYVGALLAALGLYFSLRTPGVRPLAWVIVAAFMTYLCGFGSLAALPLDRPAAMTVISRFWMMPNLVVFLWSGLGIAWLADRVKLVPLAYVGVALTLVVAQAALHWKAEDMRGNWYFADFATSVLDSLPPHSLMLSKGDVYYSAVRYLQISEGHRLDVRFVDREVIRSTWGTRMYRMAYPDVVLPGESYGPDKPRGFSLKQLLDANVAGFPIYMCYFARNDPELRNNQDWDRDYSLQPYGFLLRVNRRSAGFDPNEYYEATAAVFASFRPRMARPPVPGTFEELLWNGFWEREFQRGLYILEQVRDKPDNTGGLLLAARALARSAERNPVFSRNAYKFLGYTYELLMARDRTTYRPRMIEAWQKYLADPLEGDADVPAIRRAIGQPPV